MQPLRVAFVVPTLDRAENATLQAEWLLRAWQTDAHVGAPTVLTARPAIVSYGDDQGAGAFSQSAIVQRAADAVPAPLTHGVHGLLAPLADYQTLGHHVPRLLASPHYAPSLALAAHTTCDAWSWPRVREPWVRTYTSVLVPSTRKPRTSHIEFFPGSIRFAGADPLIGERTDSPAAPRRRS